MSRAFIQKQVYGRPARAVPTSFRSGLSPAITLLRGSVKTGNLLIVCDGHTPVTAGDDTGPEYIMRVRRPSVLYSILHNPDPRLGETWMEGEWTLEQGDLGGFLKMLAANSPEAREDAGEVMIRAFRNNSPQKLNGVKRSRINARHHYDIGNDLYASFLDSDMNYSCAFFGHAHMNLEQAQANKLSTTLKRLDVKPEMKVLDIGCGWGSLCRYASKNSRALSVTGITLAEDQAAYARKLVDPEYRNKLIYKIEDYREHARNHIGEYDRIVSTGMFEHVGEKNFRTYFAAIRKLLAGNGLALIHSILRPTSGRPTSIWMDRYIFPGGCIPWLPDMLEAAKAEGLEPVTKPYIHDSFHYAQTLRHWRENFNQAWPHLDQTRYDKRFFRMWNFYLAASEASFDGLGLHVGQILFRKA